jgi:hypothetical protein
LLTAVASVVCNEHKAKTAHCFCFALLLFSATAACVTTPGTSPEFTCSLGDVIWSANDTVNVTVPVIANSSTNATLVNTATITADGGNQIVNSTGNATVNVVAGTNNATRPTLKVVKSGPKQNVKPGDVFSFNVTAGVANGTANPLILVDELQSADVKFVAPLPAGTSAGMCQAVHTVLA